MSIEQTKCKSCGANLERLEDNNFYCPHCKSTYVLSNDVNNTYITNNENIVKNFYGNTAVKNELDNEKIDSYFVRIYDYYFSGDYSNAKEYVMKILTKQSNNVEANILNNVLNRVKGTNGRYSYIGRQLDNFIPTIKKWIVEKQYLQTSQNFERLIIDRLSSGEYTSIMEHLENKFYYYEDYAKHIIQLLQPLVDVINDNNVPEIKNIKDCIDNIISNTSKYITLCQNKKEQEEQYNNNHKTKKILYSSFFILGIIASVAVAIILKSGYSALMTILAIVIGCFFYKFIKEY